MPKVIKTSDPGQPVRLEVELLPGDIVGGGGVCDYKIVDFIGEGGMGRVYHAVVHRSADPEDVGKPRALKFLQLRTLHQDPDAVARFLSEVEILGNIRHKHLVEVLDHGTYEIISRYHGTIHLPFMAMELLELFSLTDILEYMGGKMNPVLVYGMTHQICEAAIALHVKGIVHRDIKPGNILVDVFNSQWAFKLGDCGIAKQLFGSLVSTNKNIAVGSPLYMPREQHKGEQPTAKNDIFSIGAVAFEALTGRPPFALLGNKISILLSGPNPPKAPSLRDYGDFDPAVDEMIARCLSHDPADRPDALELGQFAYKLRDSSEKRWSQKEKDTLTDVAHTLFKMKGDREVLRQVQEEERQREGVVDAHGSTVRRDTEVSRPIAPPRALADAVTKGRTAAGKGQTLRMFFNAIVERYAPGSSAASNDTPAPFSRALNGGARDDIEARARAQIERAIAAKRAAPTKRRILVATAVGLGCVMLIGVGAVAGLMARPIAVKAAIAQGNEPARPLPEPSGPAAAAPPETSLPGAMAQGNEPARPLPETSAPRVATTRPEPPLPESAKKEPELSSLTPPSSPQSKAVQMPVGSAPSVRKERKSNSSALEPTTNVADQARAIMLRDPDAAKAMLMQRLTRKKATSEELTLLRTICKAGHDYDCVRRCSDGLGDGLDSSDISK